MMPNIDKDDANATRYEMTDSLDDLITFQQTRCTAAPSSHADKAILARLVSLRDAGKELPEPVAYYWWPEGMREDKANGFTPMIYKPDYDALRAIAVADRARVKELEERERLRMAGISTAAIGYWKEGDSIHPDYDTVALRDVAKLYVKYESAESSVRALEAEREAMMAKLREPTKEMREAGALAGFEIGTITMPQVLAIFKAMTAAMGVE